MNIFTMSGAPLRIPRNATNTRIFCQQASCVYSFPNVTASANKVYLDRLGATACMHSTVHNCAGQLMIFQNHSHRPAGRVKSNPSLLISTEHNARSPWPIRPTVTAVLL